MDDLARAESALTPADRAASRTEHPSPEGYRAQAPRELTYGSNGG